MAWSTRFLMAVAFLAVGVVFAPDVLGSRLESPAAAVTAARLSHLLAFATAWGAALWVTFIGGIIMFKNLPRHQFGNLQSKMFPAYFMLVFVCSAISVAAFAFVHPWKSALTTERYQLGFLLAALGFNLSNLIVFTPMTIENGRILGGYFSQTFQLKQGAGFNAEATLINDEGQSVEKYREKVQRPSWPPGRRESTNGGLSSSDSVSRSKSRSYYTPEQANFTRA